MSFHAWQRVVCIKDSPWHLLFGDAVQSILPRRGCVYRITGGDEWENIEFITLDGFPTDYHFDARAFRPLIERKTDISIFKKLLTPTEPQWVRNTRELCGND